MSRRQIVLIVDDDAADVLLMEEALSVDLPDGVSEPEVHHVRDGEQALEFLNQRGGYDSCPRPDLVFLDLNMPRVGGREVLSHVKTGKDGLAAIPVVVFSTSESRSDIETSYEHGANAYVVKPVEYDRLSSAVRSVRDFYGRVAAWPLN